MGSLLIISLLLLSTVFVVAGVGKLADNSGSRKAIIDFGIPDFLSPFLAICLPIVELALAIALIPTFTAWWGALGSLILLLAFSVAIGVNLVQGKKPDCHCFGQMHSKPVGISTLVRNGVLAGLSVLIVGQTSNHVGPSVIEWANELNMGVSILPITVGATILFVIGEGWLLSQLMRQNGRLLVRVDNLELRLEQRGVIHPSNQGLAVGVLSPNFQLTDLSGTVFLHDKVFFQRSISSSTNSPSYLLDYCGHILLSYAI